MFFVYILSKFPKIYVKLFQNFYKFTLHFYPISRNIKIISKFFYNFFKSFQN